MASAGSGDGPAFAFAMTDHRGEEDMCVALPGRVLSIHENRAKVDFSGNIVDVHTGAVTAAPGDYVLVHAGCALEVLTREDAAEILSVFSEIEQVRRPSGGGAKIERA
ncbi:MAG: HypC/HybG/HupF family hydrogenase formation chaperone [Clostridiales Family XIII bacterium]|nr:HypC/HybG/HupF family hydrogenase formation chaperone [Clostridiales Family XIII bacterium]